MNLHTPFNAKPSVPNEHFAFFSPQSESLLFAPGGPIAIYCHTGFRSVSLSWTLARNLFQQPFLTSKAIPLPGNKFLLNIPTEHLHPGFYDIRVQLDCGESELREGICTFGYDVDAMPVPETRPADFSTFWESARLSLTEISLDSVHGPVQRLTGAEINAYNVAQAGLPPDYDPDGHRCEEIEYQRVNFAALDGRRIYGWLAKPIGPGPFPTMLVLPGAGNNSRPIPAEHARHGYLALDIQVHGFDVDLPEYPQRAAEPTATPETFYDYRIYTNALQAVNYLVSRPDVDPARIVAVGGSQGGRLTTIVAALDTRIAAAIPAITHFSNHPYQEWARIASSSIPPLDGMDCTMPPPLPDTSLSRILGYFDIVSFAPDVHCPVLMNMGLIDKVSPPTGVYAVYLKITAEDKQMVPLPGLGHDWSAEFDRRAWRWLEARLAPESLHQKAGRNR